MKIPPPGYPCKLCGRVMHDTIEGRGFQAGKLRFVVCLDCGRKIEVAARATTTVVTSGLAALLQQKAPGLLPVLKQLRAAVVQAEQKTPIQ